MAALTQASAAQQAQAILPSLKQPWLRRCSNQQQPRACFAESWCRRQLGRSRWIPSTRPRRCWTAHRNAPANHASRNNGPSPAPPAINPPSNATPRFVQIAPQKRNQAAKPLSRKRQTCAQITNSSYLAQSNHRNAAAQSCNRHGRVSSGRVAVANLRE